MPITSDTTDSATVMVRQMVFGHAIPSNHHMRRPGARRIPRQRDVEDRNQAFQAWDVTRPPPQ
jgi:hypothetical protein